MSRVNPLYIVAILLVVFLFTFMQLQTQKEQLVELRGEYSEVKGVASELVGLKRAYGDAKKSKKSLQRVLRSSVLKPASLTINYTKKGVKIVSNSIDKKALNYLMGKVMNASYNITALKIQRLSESKASLNMEIQW